MDERDWTEDEQMWIGDLRAALEDAAAALDRAGGPADELATSGIQVLDEIGDAHSMVRGALRAVPKLD